MFLCLRILRVCLTAVTAIQFEHSYFIRVLLWLLVHRLKQMWSAAQFY